MTLNYLTIYHNGSTLQVGDSIRLDIDPSLYMGEPDLTIGEHFKMYNADIYRIVLTSESL